MGSRIQLGSRTSPSRRVKGVTSPSRRVNGVWDRDGPHQGLEMAACGLERGRGGRRSGPGQSRWSRSSSRAPPLHLAVCGAAAASCRRGRAGGEVEVVRGRSARSGHGQGWSLENEESDWACDFGYGKKVNGKIFSPVISDVWTLIRSIKYNLIKS
jgi:hypothetical protein